MRTKDTSVECLFHPALTGFLFGIDQMYRDRWGTELVITSGSEPQARHSYTSLHYATPCQAADTRSWDIEVRSTGQTITAEMQHAAMTDAAILYCQSLGVPVDWMEVILEKDHIHIEYQPKRREEFH